MRVWAMLWLSRVFVRKFKWGTEGVDFLDGCGVDW